MIFRLYKPAVFQGNLKKKNYFEGWYFKHVSSDLKHAYSFIPGISLSEKDPHSFIQMLDGISGKSEYFSFPLHEFSWHRNKLFLRIGKSVFTENFIDLDIRDKKAEITGRVEYSDIVRYPRRIFSPGIMGWYSFIPFMECKHGIVSVNHNLSGILNINGVPADFNNGKGYIEKDWGTSFPESWLWIQSNNFSDHNTSFSFSVAKIPWMGKFFIGFICFLYFDRKFYLFSTYNNSSITEFRRSGKSVFITLKNNRNILRIICTRSFAGELKAPVSGQMTRGIKESIDASVRLALYDKDNKVQYTDSGRRAGMELIEKIFEYFKGSDNGEKIQEYKKDNAPATVSYGR